MFKFGEMFSGNSQEEEDEALAEQVMNDETIPANQTNGEKDPEPLNFDHEDDDSKLAA